MPELIYQCQNTTCGAFDRDHTSSPPNSLHCWKCHTRESMLPVRPDLQAEAKKRFLAQP